MPWSRTTEYALRAMVALAGRGRESITTAQIAGTARIPAGYLSKVLQTLGRADLVKAQRGLGGGFALARSPQAISVLQVVNAVDPLRRIRECPLGVAGHGRNLCALHRRMDDALATVERVFAETTLADLLRESGGSPLCDVAASAAVTGPRTSTAPVTSVSRLRHARALPAATSKRLRRRRRR